MRPVWHGRVALAATVGGRRLWHRLLRSSCSSLWEETVKIVVDANESRCGLADLPAKNWAFVEVRRLDAGDVAVGERVLVERKTIDDYIASLDDGRLLRQAAKLAAAVPRPLFILEGDASALAARIDAGSLRGTQLAIAVGFRIPVLTTQDLVDTASCIRHMAAQEARRQTRRRHTAAPPMAGAGQGPRRRPICPETLDLILEIPNVGRERALAIAQRVGSVRELCQLGIRDLLSVPGIRPETAASIVDTLRGVVSARRKEGRRYGPGRGSSPLRRGPRRT